MNSVIKSARYDYIWNSERRSIVAFVYEDNSCQIYRLVFPGGTLGEHLGTYSWDGESLSGSGNLSSNQKENLENLLKAPNIEIL